MSAKIGLILPLFLFGGLSIKVLIYDVRLLYVVVLMLLVVYSKKIILYSFFRKELLLIALPIPTLLLFILFQRLAGVQSNYTISLVMSLVVFQGVVLLGYFYYVDVRKERHSKFVYFSIVALIIILLSEKLLGVGYVSSYLLRGLNETLFVMLGFYVLAIQMNPDKRKVHLLLGFVLFVTAYYLSARAISFLVLMGMVIVFIPELRNIKFKTALMFLVIFGAISIFAVLSSPSISDKFRVSFILNGLNAFYNNPIFGIGFSNLSELNNQAVLDVLQTEGSSKKLDSWAPNAHNIYIQSMSDFGLFGGFLSLLFVFSDIINKKKRFLPVWFLAAHGFFISALVVPFLWFVYGAMIAEYHNNKKGYLC